MTDPSLTSGTPDAAQIVSFLRRFSDLLATGPNAEYLRRAAELIETLTVRVAAASEQEDLWRFKYESLNRHADVLEAECNALKHDVERQQDRLRARDDELAASRVASEREHDALTQKIAFLEDRRGELRSAFDRINHPGEQAIEPRGGAEGIGSGKPAWEAEANLLPAQPGGECLAAGETNAIVPKTTLRQARAQFEYLAKEFIPLGDIASQVMCELGAYTMDLALIEGQVADRLPVGEVARSILAPTANAGHS